MFQHKSRSETNGNYFFIALICLFLLTVPITVNSQRKVIRGKATKTSRNKKIVVVDSSPEGDGDAPGISYFDGVVVGGIYQNKNLKFSFKIPQKWLFFASGEPILNDQLGAKSFEIKAEPNKEKGLDLLAAMPYQPGQASDAILSVRQRSLETNDSLAQTAEQTLAAALKNNNSKILKKPTSTIINGVQSYVFEIEIISAAGVFFQRAFLIPRFDRNILQITWILKKDSDRQIIEETMKTFRLE